MKVLFMVAGIGIGFLAYRQGVKDGQSVKSDKPIAPIFKKTLKAAKEVDPIEEGIANLLAYDGSSQEDEQRKPKNTK